MPTRKKLLLGLLTAAAFFGALEVVLRLRERLLGGGWVIDQRYTQHYIHRDWPIYEPHPYLGRALKYLGFRGREVAHAKTWLAELLAPAVRAALAP